MLEFKISYIFCVTLPLAAIQKRMMKKWQVNSYVGNVYVKKYQLLDSFSIGASILRSFRTPLKANYKKKKCKYREKLYLTDV